VILNAEESTVDWNRLIWLAEKHRVIRPLGLTLRYLHESFEAPVPEWVLQTLRRLPQSRIEEVEFRIRNQCAGGRRDFRRSPAMVGASLVAPRRHCRSGRGRGWTSEDAPRDLGIEQCLGSSWRGHDPRLAADAKHQAAREILQRARDGFIADKK